MTTLTVNQPNRYSTPLFAGTEDAEQLLMATMETMETEVENYLDTQDPLWKYLKAHNLIQMDSDIGTEVRYPYMDRDTGTVKFFTGYDGVNNVPADALGVIQYTWGHVVGTQMYNREELVKNSGRRQLIDLIETKQEQLTTEMHNFVATGLRSTSVADGRRWNGLYNLTANNTASGGVDPTADGKDWWNPQLIYKTGTTAFTLSSELRAGLRKALRTTGRYGAKADVILCGEDLFDAQQAWAESISRISLAELKDTQGWGDHQAFMHNGTNYIYDDTLAAKHGKILNFKKGVKIRAHSGSYFTFTPWQMMQGSVAKKRDCLLYLCVSARDRRCLGEITFS